MKKYFEMYERNPQLFGDEHNIYSLAPLSAMMADLFDSFEHSEVLECMQLLGAKNIDNYSEDFIMKLYENYAQMAFMEKMNQTNM